MTIEELAEIDAIVTEIEEREQAMTVGLVGAIEQLAGGSRATF